MSTIVELKSVNKKKWESALQEAGVNGTLFQSSYWADFLEMTYKDHPIYVACLDRRGDIQALLLAIESCYAKHPSFRATSKRHKTFLPLYKHVLMPIFQKTLPYIVWENGPIVLPRFREETDKDTLNGDIIRKTIKIAKERKCYSLAFVRPSFSSDQSFLFSSLNFEKKRMGTRLINLNESLEVLWKNVNRTTRQNIERSKLNMQIETIGSIADLRLFYDMHIENCIRANRTIRPFSFFSSLWNYFSSKGKVAGSIAYYNGKIIGSVLLLTHNLTAHLYALGDSNFSRLNRINVLDSLLWHQIKWTRERDFKCLDLSGVELHKIDAGDAKATGIYKFKSKWGGQLVEYHDYRKMLRSSKTVNILNRFLSEGEGFHN